MAAFKSQVVGGDEEYEFEEPRPRRVQKLLKAYAVNLAASPSLSDEWLERLGQQICQGVNADNEGRRSWCESHANIRKLNACVREPMQWPVSGIPKAAVPIINVAVSQWQARERPQLMPSKGMVNVLGTGQEDQPKAKRAEKAINTYLRKLRRYRDGMDKMLGAVALDGIAIRKISWDDKERKLSCVTCPASEIVVSSAPSGDIRDAARVTHLVRMTAADIAEKVEDGEFLDADLGPPSCVYDDYGNPIDAMVNTIQGLDGERTIIADMGDDDEILLDDTPRMILECHTRIKLPGLEDEPHPVIVWVDKESEQVLRIVSREYEWDGQRKVFHFFVKYGFLPNVDGFYDMGLGTLLETYNAMANTVANVLIVQGLWKSSVTGFVSTRSGIPKEDLVMRPGQLQPVDWAAEDLDKIIKLLEFEEPSQVLLALLGQIQGWGKEIASVNDMLQGMEQPSNQTATTTITLVEQGLKLFAAVHARMLDCYQEELQQIFELLRIFMPDEEYNSLLGDDGSEEYAAWKGRRQQYMMGAVQAEMRRSQGMEASAPESMGRDLPFSIEEDLALEYDIIPVADPQITSQAQRMIAAKEVYTTVMQNPLTANNPAIVREAMRRYLDAMGEVDLEKILPPEPPPPEPPKDLDQVLEDAMFMKGDVSTQVLPTQNHAEHLQHMAEFDATGAPEAMEPGAREAREQHRREHMSFQWLALNQQQPGGPADAQDPMALPVSPGAEAGGADPFGAPEVGRGPVHDLPAPAAGLGEALDNASPQLLGKFDGLAHVTE